MKRFKEIYAEVVKENPGRGGITMNGININLLLASFEKAYDILVTEIEDLKLNLLIK